ncbi:hypothetical protein [Phaeobacter porticola]|uniref:Phospholipase A2 n=1 Tax=Phaeobacter porticola TaxID=1844006 RepID=A0A1L3I8I6_9RHOB|nr:hypothetical protein [Phaeobacter porticola]APG48417.1 hypothetical protein PhaeoP97_03042 [Phaeobacter porticola]
MRLRPDWRYGVAGALSVLQALSASVAIASDDMPPGLWNRSEGAAHRGLMQVAREAGHKPSPFVTDGCSGGLSAIWRQLSGQPDPNLGAAGGPPFETCCVAHDRRYHNADGATDAVASQIARLQADVALRSCVETRLTDLGGVATPIASAMYHAVRFGGGPCSGLSWRWGYGYDACDAVFRPVFGEDARD